MNFSRDKYKFFTFKNQNGGTTVTAMSTYAGQKVKGYAKCSPNDNFDEETGKDLAAARCNYKVAMKRLARATDKYVEASAAAAAASAHFEEMKRYYMDAVDQVDNAREKIDSILNRLK